MGSLLTAVLALLILAFTVYQIKRVYESTKKGKCVECSHADTCAANPDNVSELQVDFDQQCDLK